MPSTSSLRALLVVVQSGVLSPSEEIPPSGRSNTTIQARSIGRVAERLARLERRVQVRQPALVSGAAPHALSDSELAVLRLLPSSLSNREIGEQLFISVNTVETHLRSIYAKLGASSREQAVGRARELGVM